MRTPDSNPKVVFRNRTEAGRVLAHRLQAYLHRPNVIVCALPRGGVPVGAEIAGVLGVPLTVFIVRKLGVPGQKELAMGAITSGGMRLINHSVTEALNIPASVIEDAAKREMLEIVRRETIYSRGRAMPDMKDKTVILTDDGVATGSTMILAVRALRQRGSREIVVAVPVAPSDTVSELRGIADEVICLSEPEPFRSVGIWYEDFEQVDDTEVCRILDRSFEPVPSSRTA
ncbi:MAG: phosphoribosyltransferase [Candidatus Angelobacter sp.]